MQSMKKRRCCQCDTDMHCLLWYDIDYMVDTIQSNYETSYNAFQLSLSLDLRIKIDPDNEIVSFLKALDKVNLKEFMNQKVATLSGGQQQRVSVARIILKLCDIILADEPTGPLDEENSQMIMDLLKSLHALG